MQESKPVRVKIKTTQFNEIGEIETIESFYSGKRYEKNGKLYVLYSTRDKKSEAISSSSTIKIDGDVIQIVSSGEIDSKMIFEEGEAFESIYRTTYGNFNLRMYTHKVNKKISDEEIKINLDYKVEIEDLLYANNRLEIRIS